MKTREWQCLISYMGPTSTMSSDGQGKAACWVAVVTCTQVSAPGLCTHLDQVSVVGLELVCTIATFPSSQSGFLAGRWVDTMTCAYNPPITCMSVQHVHATCPCNMYMHVAYMHGRLCKLTSVLLCVSPGQELTNNSQNLLGIT